MLMKLMQVMMIRKSHKGNKISVFILLTVALLLKQYGMYTGSSIKVYDKILYIDTDASNK